MTRSAPVPAGVQPPSRVIGIDGSPLYRHVDGIGRYSSNLLHAAVGLRPDWRFVVVGFSDDRAKPYLLPELENVERVFLPIPRRLYQAVYSHVARVPVNRWVPRLDALVCTNYTIFPWVRHVPSLVTVHDLSYVDMPEVVERRNLGYLRRHVPRTMAEADAILAISAFTAERIDAVFPRHHAPVSIVDCALDAQFHDDPGPDAQHPPTTGRFLLSVGTLEPRKNLVALLRAYASLDVGIRREYSLVVVGRKGWGQGDLPDDVPAEILDSVRFTGYVDDGTLRDLYSRASLFIFPSHYEGFGLPLIEAMASGVPAVVSDIPPFRSIGQDLVDYVDPDDPRSLAVAMAHRLRSPDPARTARAQEMALTYSWARSAQQLISSIEQTLR